MGRKKGTQVIMERTNTVTEVDSNDIPSSQCEGQGRPKIFINLGISAGAKSTGSQPWKLGQKP